MARGSRWNVHFLGRGVAGFCSGRRDEEIRGAGGFAYRGRGAGGISDELFRVECKFVPSGSHAEGPEKENHRTGCVDGWAGGGRSNLSPFVYRLRGTATDF